MYLCHLVGYGAQSRYRPEGRTLEIHVQAGDNHAHTVVGELVAHLYEIHAEELCLVDAHHVEVVTLGAGGVVLHVLQYLS